ncbi:MAG: exodeoxyribonuclease III [Patescibacteria group bacterium]|nr:exodeoxyribonuclease III [Patescibacteria group bacterium]MDD5121359.1 exodeoxyribonuclease III [Patescibacteria group bacterium]MDD5222071.1 exodeoxyribonuclease III [Patescibacteria group bacterium]MDD5395722.1 exodeoxyribonuclease III [Patescibacteria group bacterium]
MKILSWNVNGLRSVYKKGLIKSLKSLKPDIVCFQEIKAQESDIPHILLKYQGYFSYLNLAERKGYSGIIILAKKAPLKIINKLGLKRFDQEGRFLELVYSDFILINIYMPHGSRDKKNLKYKLKVYKYFLNHLKKIKNKKIIICGDFNIAHEDIDLARPKSNRHNIMFTSPERKQISDLINLKFIDTFRNFNQEGGYYTWWPYFAKARQRNLGWRIDYIFISKNLIKRLRGAYIYSKVLGSDHCPIGVGFK